MDSVTNKEAFIAIYEFLDIQYFKGYENLGGFLSGMMIMADGIPADPALWQDWLDIIGNHKKLSFDQAYKYLFKFLNFETNLGWPEIGIFLKTLSTDTAGEISDPKAWEEWLVSIEKAKSYPEEAFKEL